jgi:hypothetical protein
VIIIIEMQCLHDAELGLHHLVELDLGDVGASTGVCRG